MGIIERIVKWIEEKGIFIRERKSDLERALVCCYIRKIKELSKLF